MMTGVPPKILIVDDTPANLVAMRKLLRRIEAQVVEARSGEEALSACLDHEFAIVLLDVNMPGMDGFEVAGFLSGEEKTRETPIIFVTAAYGDDINRLKGYQFGAVDYIAKPVNDVILRSKVQVFLDLYRSKQRLKDLLSELNLRNQELKGQIAERQKAEAEARHLATHDALTGLPNRLLFMDRLSRSIERSDRRNGPFALLFVDIDGFKPVNDMHGHQVGDELLRQIASRVNEAVRGIDTVARLGGDEFAVIIEGPADGADAQLSARRISAAIRREFDLPQAGAEGTVRASVSASIGVGVYPVHGQDPDSLVRAADAAMYEAKRAGKGRIVSASPAPATQQGGRR